MAFQYFVSKLLFSDHSAVDLIEGDITLVIGPNNCGKSEALRNIWERISIPDGEQRPTKVVKDVKVVVSVGPEAVHEIVATLEENPSNPGQVGRMGMHVGRADLLQLNANADWLRRTLHQLLVRLLGAGERLNITSPPQSIDLTTQIKSHPIHYLYADEDLEKSFSTDFRKAFGTDLTVNHFAGQIVPLHIGDRPGVPPGGDRLSQGYRTAISKFSLLHQQGDGMRSFVGTLLWARVSDYRVLLVDEPEAFLHPPQARLLARVLAKTKKSTSQIIAATHSGDFLRGVLDSNVSKLRVVRLTRKDEINPTTVLSPEQLKELWSDPLIRQSNVLDALFHEQCVVCESEGDSQFYAGVLNALSDLKPDQVVPDTMFVSVGGKDRVPKATAALSRLNVRVKVILDFDVLRSEQPLRAIFESLRGTWGNIQTHWKVVNQAVSGKKAQLDVKDVTKRISSVLGDIKTDYVSDATLEDIRDITRKASAWSEAKTIGDQFIPAGQATQEYQILSQKLQTQGVFIVQVGELEGFDKTIPGHGPAWVGGVMQKNLGTDPALEKARQFVNLVVK